MKPEDEKPDPDKSDENGETLQKARPGDGTLQGPTHPGGTVAARSAFKKLDQACFRVCILRTPAQNYGTGFLVGPKWVLTNYHVVETFVKNKNWQDLIVGFDFEDFRSTLRPAKLDAVEPCLLHREYDAAVDYDPNAQLLTHRWGDDKLDFALLQLDEEVGFDVVDELSNAPRGWFTMLPEPVWGGGGMILQFPNGQPLQWDFAGFCEPRFNENKTRVRYLIYGDYGSSGSPCLNNNADLLALHHAGRFRRPAVPEQQDNGANGKEKSKNQKPDLENQGIPIECIIAAIRKHAPKFTYIGKAPPIASKLTPFEGILYEFLQAMVGVGEENLIRQTANKILKSCPKGLSLGGFSKSDLLELVRLAQCGVNGDKFELALREARHAIQHPPASVTPLVSGLPVDYQPLFLGPDSPLIDREDLGEKARCLLEGSTVAGLCINGGPDTGRSHLYYYFAQLRTSLKFKMSLIDLDQVVASGNPSINALRLAKEIDRSIKLGFDFARYQKPNEIFKIEEFRNALHSKLDSTTGKIVLYIDGLDTAAPSADAIDLVKGLVDLIVENSLDGLRLVLVGLKRDAFVRNMACREILTNNFSEQDVIDWFTAAFEDLKRKRPTAFSDDEKLMAIAEVLEIGEINTAPNVKRIGEMTASVYSRFA